MKDVYMATIKDKIDAQNLKALGELQDTYTRIHSLAKLSDFVKGSWLLYLEDLCSWILMLEKIRTDLASGVYKSCSIDTLKEVNNSLYAELLHYESSWANPRYAVSFLGDGYGQIAAWGRVIFRDCISFVYGDKIARLAEANQMFLDLVDLFTKGLPSKTEIITILARPVRDFNPLRHESFLFERYDPEYTFVKSIQLESDLSDASYLYKYGRYISENEINLSRFFNNYPNDKLNLLADTVFSAYLRGFVLAKKDISIKSTVNIVVYIGQERLALALAERARANGLEPVMARLNGTEASKQYLYDHRFDEALYLDKDFADNKIKMIQESYKNCESICKMYSGIIYIESFGEEPFAPESKKENLALSEEQQKLRQHVTGAVSEINEKYAPEEEVSFNITAFPSPEIGEQFNEIFSDICEINMMDSDECGHIQQHIIDELDLADHVEILGSNGNRTKLTVALHRLKNPSKESIFENCGADVNVPVGEVFTSPMLKGTNGVLHVPETFLWGLKYVDLELTFTDGWVSDYMCANFSKPEENKKFIEENLLFSRKSLPLGEFAIGTNTLAYTIAKKYKMIEKMPVLIVEKMGPHFAIGDTCYSHAEDFPVFNPYNGKETVARDNEVSILRKTDSDKAYFQSHTDITLPYDGIAYICAVHANGKRTDIIKDGRFVLKGTETFNDAFNRV